MKSTILLFCFFIASLALLGLCPQPVDGCAIAPGKNSTAATASEEAFIYYEPETETQHFVRTATFSGDSLDFGFLVPTPNKPEISEFDKSIFSILADTTKPKTVTRTITKTFTDLSCDADKRMTASEPGFIIAKDRKAVSVVEQKRVGNLDVAILQAETPQAIRDWLAKNQYNDRPELTEWLKPYTGEKWFISAFKIAADSPASNSNNSFNAINSTTVKMSFKTKQPFYPYREPSDAIASKQRLLRLYVLASTYSDGNYGPGELNLWDAKKAWAGDLTKENKLAINEKTKLELPLDKELILTEFEDRNQTRKDKVDLYFGPSKQQIPIERPPNIIYVTVDRTLNDLTMIALIGLLGLAIFAVVVRLLRKIESK